MTTREQAERRAAFYADLRGGKFNQGTGELRVIHDDGSRTYCCLGVAQERYQDDETTEADTVSTGRGQFFYSWRQDRNELACLSIGALDYYGFHSNNPTLTDGSGLAAEAANWNDRLHKTFPEIADMFEKAYPAVTDE